MKLLLRFLFKTDRRCRRYFFVNMIFKGIRGLFAHRSRQKRGNHFPAFHFISITDECNLHCQGCWVSRGSRKRELDIAAVDSIIRQSKANLGYFFGILGGEPLMHPGLFDIFARHRDAYFQLFTNGLLLTEEIAVKLKRCANVTPLISFEGDEDVADRRRGGREVYRKTLESLKRCAWHGLVTGIAMSVCKSNLNLALSDDFLKMIWDEGASYVWYYIFRPSGDNPSYELALSPDEIATLRRFMVDARTRHPLAIVDSYWRADGTPFCPAAESLSHHVNPSGEIEACPVLQFSDHTVGDLSELEKYYSSSEMLHSLKNEIRVKTNGCVLMEDSLWLADFIEKNGAKNTSGREGYLGQLRAAPRLCSHGSAPVIPEKSLIYKFAKRNAFFGMGSYG